MVAATLDAPSKPCTECREVKPFAEYSLDRRKRGGRAAKCKECKAAYVKRHRAADPERNRAIGRAWRAENLHSSWEQAYRRRARKYGHAPVVERFTRDDLIARYGDACAHCGGPFEQLDHYPVPVALGGRHSLENCRPSCEPCNRGMGAGVRTTHTEVQATAWTQHTRPPRPETGE